MKPCLLVSCATVVLLISAPCWGQRMVPRGPMNTGQLITLSRHTPFDQALRVIQALADQVVVDTQRLKLPIGVDVDRQPWLSALVQIAKRNGLSLSERQGYYELVQEDEPSDEERQSPQGVTVDSREVNISAIFFQADRSAIRELGIDWSTLSSGRVDLKTAQRVTHMGTGDAFTVGLRSNLGRSMSVEALLKAFESNNTGEVVANPQVKVQSGKTGYIQVGSDFSITTSDFAGNAITQFYSTGTILTVTPTIRSQEGIDYVDLEVEAERSSLVDPVRNLISKTVARTSALLRDGEQTAVGGLYGREESISRAGMPLLKDMPGWFFGLRYLFGHNRKQVAKTELVVLLKVDIVPSVRQRGQTAANDRGSMEIIRHKRSTFEEMLRRFRERTSQSDSLQGMEWGEL